MAGASGIKERRLQVYFESGDERERFRAQADAEGYANKFSTWVLDKMRLGAAGTMVAEGYVEDLRDQLQAMTKRWDEERALANDCRVRIKELEAQTKFYADEFQKIAKFMEKQWPDS